VSPLNKSKLRLTLFQYEITLSLITSLLYSVSYELSIT
jgi:hypothetical protein